MCRAWGISRVEITGMRHCLNPSLLHWFYSLRVNGMGIKYLYNINLFLRFDKPKSYSRKWRWLQSKTSNMHVSTLSCAKKRKWKNTKCHSQCVYCSSVVLTKATTFKLGVKTIKNNLTWSSVAMVMRYDVTSSRWSSHFWVKIHVFSTSFNNKSKSCG